VANLKTNVLCKGHSEALSDVDTSAGQFARALDVWRDVQDSRARLAGLKWSPHVITVDGPPLAGG
jgi:hypothetical protein